MKLKFPGIAVHMNGQNYYIPSLSTLDMRTVYDRLMTPLPENASILDTIDKFLPLIGRAVRRNYPDVTDEQLADWLDMNTIPHAIQALTNASGLTAVSEGE
jgi:hypothetical protein